MSRQKSYEAYFRIQYVQTFLICLHNFLSLSLCSFSNQSCVYERTPASLLLGNFLTESLNDFVPFKRRKQVFDERSKGMFTA